MNGQDPFDDTANGAALPRRIALGTMHGKETALVPAFARLGVDLVVAPGVDTDRFGSFDGMTPRAGTMEEAARAKARAAMAATGLTSGLASEGAFHFTGSTTREAQLRETYKEVIANARRYDAQEGTAEGIVATDWLESRL